MSHNVEQALGQAQAPAGLASGAPFTVPDDQTFDPHTVVPRESKTGDGAFCDESLDSGRTRTDLHATEKPKTTTDVLPAETTLGKVEKETDISAVTLAAEKNTLKGLSPGRKNILLLCFCLSMFSECHS